METSTKHLKYSLGLSKLIFQLFQVYCIHILMIHSNNQTNLSQTLSKTIFKSSFIVTTVKNWIYFEFIAICDHCGFLGLQICNIEILLGKDKLSSCRICIYFAQFNFDSVPHEYLTFLSIKTHWYTEMANAIPCNAFLNLQSWRRTKEAVGYGCLFQAIFLTTIIVPGSYTSLNSSVSTSIKHTHNFSTPVE